MKASITSFTLFFLLFSVAPLGAESAQIGDTDRLDTTVISDAVNIAARIESLNRKLGTGILITEETLRRVPANQLRSRYVGETKLKGKQKLIKVHQILDSLSEEDFENYETTRPAFQKAILSFESGRYSEAYTLFNEVVAQNILDGCSRYYMSCIERKKLNLRTHSDVVSESVLL